MKMFLNPLLTQICSCRYSAQLKRKAWGVLGFWKTSKSSRRGVAGGRPSSANSTPSVAAGVSMENPFGHTRETLQKQRTTADVTAVTRPASLRGPRSTSVRRSPTVDDICLEKNETPAAAAAPRKDQSVQTTDELLQPLISNGLRQRRRPAADEDASSPVRQGNSIDELVDVACRPWRRHSLSSMSPLSSRLASPVDDVYQPSRPPPVLLPGDLDLDDVLGDVSRRSLSPLPIAEMTSPPRRRQGFQPLVQYPLRRSDVNGRRWDGPPPAYQEPNYIVGLPALSQPSRTEAPPPQRAPLRRQKPFLGATKVQSAGSSRRRDIVADVAMSPASSKSSGACRDGADDGGDSSEGAGAKSLSTVSLEDAICRSMSRLSDDDDVVSRGCRVTAVPLSNVGPRGVTRNDVRRNNVTRSSAVTSRRPARPVVLSSDV